MLLKGIKDGGKLDANIIEGNVGEIGGSGEGERHLAG